MNFDAAYATALPRTSTNSCPSFTITPESATTLPNSASATCFLHAKPRNTYFRRAFQWPEHAQNFTDNLSLTETAALLRERAALIANHFGLMHLGVALAVPTFGIFGEREPINATNFFLITKGLPCKAACRRGPLGWRDCDRHL
jgi:ADP-heptose:LPS heptosyltransferase